MCSQFRFELSQVARNNRLDVAIEYCGTETLELTLAAGDFMGQADL